jgi:hypothetical protein
MLLLFLLQRLIGLPYFDDALLQHLVGLNQPSTPVVSLLNLHPQLTQRDLGVGDG